MKEITLQLSNGKEMTFSERWLATIIEERLSKQGNIVEFAQKPTENKWFKINPEAIDQKLFKKKREDTSQEQTRKLILEAFEELKRYPALYGKKIKTCIPERYWESATAKELVDMADKFGNQIADWAIQALEWAQRISNGESWESICNDYDTANSYRMIKWKDGYYKLIGGRVDGDSKFPASDIDTANYTRVAILNQTVPLIVSYED